MDEDCVVHGGEKNCVVEVEDVCDQRRRTPNGRKRTVCGGWEKRTNSVWRLAGAEDKREELGQRFLIMGVGIRFSFYWSLFWGCSGVGVWGFLGGAASGVWGCRGMG